MNGLFVPYEKPSVLDIDILKLVEHLRQRRTVREFSSVPVDPSLIHAAIEAANSAPSGANCQPWYFAVIESKEIKKKIRVEAERVEEKFYSSESNRRWVNDLRSLGTDAKKNFLTDAPVIIIIFSRKSDEYQKTYYPIESTGIATGFLISSLHYAGLSTLTHTPNPMSFLNDIVGLDRSYRPYMMVVTGYAKDGTKIPAIKKKPINEISCRL